MFSLTNRSNKYRQVIQWCKNYLLKWFEIKKAMSFDLKNNRKICREWMQTLFALPVNDSEEKWLKRRANSINLQFGGVRVELHAATIVYAANCFFRNYSRRWHFALFDSTSVTIVRDNFASLNILWSRFKIISINSKVYNKLNPSSEQK